MADEAGARRLMSAVMEAVVEPDRWPDALDTVATFFGGVGAMVEFHSPDGSLVRLGPRGSIFEQRYLDLYLEHYAATCPRARSMMRPGARAVQSEEIIGDDTALDRHPYYVDFLGPQRLRYHLALRLRRTRNELGVLAVQRLKQDGNADDEEINWMYELAPFFRSAFRARALLGELSLGADGLIGALSRLDAALVFLDGEGRALFQNDAASALLSLEPPPDWPALLVRWRQLTAATEDSAATIVRPPAGSWTARFVDLRGAMNPRVHGDVYVVMLAPVSIETVGAAAARSLTTAELRVLGHLIAGTTPIDIAEKLAVSIATIRTHIARLHEKFGVRRTLDVVRIAIAEGFGRS